MHSLLHFPLSIPSSMFISHLPLYTTVLTCEALQRNSDTRLIATAIKENFSDCAIIYATLGVWLCGLWR